MFYIKRIKCSSWKVKATLQTKQPRRQLATSRTPTYPCFAWTVKQFRLRAGEQRSKSSKSWLWLLLSFWESQKENNSETSIFQHITPRGAAKNTSKHTFTAPTSFPVSYTSWDLGRKGKSDVCSKLDHSCLWNRKILDLHSFSPFGSPSLSKYRLNFVSAPLAIFTAVSPQRCWAANHWGCISKGTLARYFPTLGNIHLGKLANIKLPSLQLDVSSWYIHVD